MNDDRWISLALGGEQTESSQPFVPAVVPPYDQYVLNLQAMNLPAQKLADAIEKLGLRDLSLETSASTDVYSFRIEDATGRILTFDLTRHQVFICPNEDAIVDMIVAPIEKWLADEREGR